MSRLLSLALDESAPATVPRALVDEARDLFGVDAVLLFDVSDREGGATFVAGDAPGAHPGHAVALGAHDPVRELLERRVGTLRVHGAGAAPLARLLAAGVEPRVALLVALPGRPDPGHVLVLVSCRPDALGNGDRELAASFASAAAAALAQGQVADEHAKQVQRQRALTRAAKTLNESLDVSTLLARICQEATTILDGDLAVVYRGSPAVGLTVMAAYNLAPEIVGHTFEPGAGLSGLVLDADRPMLTNEYQRVARPAPGSPFAMVEASLAVPFAWDEESRGVLSVGFTHRRRVDRSDLQVLETFAELAAVACRNASRHAGLAILARTDALTGCLNHAALHEGLHREIERMERGAAPALTLVLFDLDDFKQVNEEHGHLVGDELLRRVGAALQGATRPYDLAARYGGDEFALVAVEADEEEACAIAERTLARLAAAIGEFSATGTGATAGVAEWTPGVTATELVARADRALLHGKQDGSRGLAHPFSSLPESVARGRFGRRSERGLPAPPPLPAPSSSWPVVPTAAGDERLRKRTRQLALASALGARLTAMNDSQAIAEAAVEELHRAFGYFLCAVVRAHEGRVEAVAVRGDAFVRLGGANWSQPAAAGLIGRCLRTRRAVLSNDVLSEPDYHGTDETRDVRSELAVPLWVDGELWGAINLEAIAPEAFDEDDVRLVQTVADQVGSALRSAALFERLRRAYEGAAEALAAALERPRSAAALAEAAGRRLALPEPELRDLRIAAVVHDLRHAEAALADDPRRARLAAEILSSAEVLAGVRALLGGARERWDGTGGPDGLAGEAIPLGARVIAACDLLQDLLDAGLGEDEALAALREDRGADPGVVAALAAVLSETVAPGPLGG